ncbi:carbohydrate kinase family protein [Desulfogranum japonicum]|uniref:carbohydrate kinase family protein n=1 Tax=Desulfogranum japonicum TaxID=231447 RepID=UPI0003FEA089|nr:carbohydrate kinase [Desulfogranum japonicum]
MIQTKNTPPVIAGIGEILWDIVEDSEELGGAPVNFAYHAGALGAEAYAISSIGDDERGTATLKELAKRGMSTAHISILPGAVTGYVKAEVDVQGIATYTFPDNVAWDTLSVSRETMTFGQQLDAVCFGSLAQRAEKSRETILDFLQNRAPDALKVFDVNIRQQFYTKEIIRTSLECADVLKLNDEEIVLLAEMENLSGPNEEQLKALVNRYQLNLAVLTCGDKGSILVTANEVSRHPGYASQVVTTIGAGDSFTATTVLGLLGGHSLDSINEHANRVAAYVCSQQGAMPPLPENVSPGFF